MRNGNKRANGKVKLLEIQNTLPSFKGVEPVLAKPTAFSELENTINTAYDTQLDTLEIIDNITPEKAIELAKQFEACALINTDGEFYTLASKYLVILYRTLRFYHLESAERQVNATRLCATGLRMGACKLPTGQAQYHTAIDKIENLLGPKDKAVSSTSLPL